MTLKVLGSNMTLLRFPDKEIFFSYETAVAAWVKGRGYLRSSKHFSRTTDKHIGLWIKDHKATIVAQDEIDRLCV